VASSAVMSVVMSVDGPSLSAATATLNTKMSALCPGMLFEVRDVKCAPTGTALAGPPWRFTFTVAFTLTFFP